VWGYASLLGGWWVLHLALGDRLWWVALLSVFAPYLFAPLVLLAPLGLIKPRVRYWAAILLALAILWAEYGTPIAARATEGEETGNAIAGEISLLTFNVWGYSDSADTARAIVAQEIPDVVVLQELSPGMVPALVEELGSLYPYRHLNPGGGYRGGGVLSRYPMRQARLAEGSLVAGFAQVVEIEVEGRVFTLYNVHLDATAALYYIDSDESVGEKVRSSFEVRERQVDQLVADVSGRQGPVLVAGDFNMTEQSDVYRTLVRVLQDAHREVGWGLGHTFPAYGGSWRGIPVFPRMVRIDMILHSDEWAALECQVLDEHGQSDHLPVLARFALAPSTLPQSPP
jgi:endonuclease/exonuclease/phosphatase (EEP) superfamily protein YafD